MIFWHENEESKESIKMFLVKEWGKEKAKFGV